MRTSLSLSIAMITLGISFTLQAESPPVIELCDGNLYTMNSGRGAVGLLVDIHEGRDLTNTRYFSDASNRASLHSQALFSSAAMDYDKVNDRIYYASTPTPNSFHLENLDSLGLSPEALSQLGLHSKTNEPYQLAYFDVATQSHHWVGNTRFPIFRMAFDPNTGVLYGSDGGRFYTIDPNTGTQTVVAAWSNNVSSSGFTSWGDFIFRDNELLLVTNTRVFTVNTANAEVSVKFFHNIDFVTGASLDQNNEILIAAKNQNVTGEVNSSHLWRLNPEAEYNYLPVQKYLGLFPVRVDGMARVDSQQDTCYPPSFYATE
ncbi:hypothetical protein [Shewanella sp. NIFS-20-20]|uniref:hypothetical protein n=1 Tax=Shewanella sp. NIFS-20-20 TaxID=2853806 RepID=UPI001C48F79F|nr:hypothetical protein [Shewanella sp. NIFS-20-20]MBV7314678.1 hypothetical protein [Shewanella sp. NIFS-20-20]